MRFYSDATGTIYKSIETTYYLVDYEKSVMNHATTMDRGGSRDDSIMMERFMVWNSQTFIARTV